MGSFGLCGAEFVGSQLETCVLRVSMVQLPILGLTPGLLGSRVLLIAAPWSHLAFLVVDPMSVLQLGWKACEHPEHP